MSYKLTRLDLEYFTQEEQNIIENLKQKNYYDLTEEEKNNIDIFFIKQQTQQTQQTTQKYKNLLSTFKDLYEHEEMNELFLKSELTPHDIRTIDRAYSSYKTTIEQEKLDMQREKEHIKYIQEKRRKREQEQEKLRVVQEQEKLRKQEQELRVQEQEIGREREQEKLREREQEKLREQEKEKLREREQEKEKLRERGEQKRKRERERKQYRIIQELCEANYNNLIMLDKYNIKFLRIICNFIINNRKGNLYRAKIILDILNKLNKHRMI